MQKLVRAYDSKMDVTTQETEDSSHCQTPYWADNTMEHRVRSHSAWNRVVSNPLKNFTIPKIRRAADRAYLASCLTDSREYHDIQIALSEARLNIGCDLRASWQFGETKLIINDDLEKKFVAKRSEMRKEGRPLQEHFCFRVLPRSAVMNIYLHGLHVDGAAPKALGNPTWGVYVFRHIDVALQFAQQKGSKSNYIMVFKAGVTLMRLLLIENCISSICCT
ncbi:hypothetical protein FKM82_000327 [Ascaphus truei]